MEYGIFFITHVSNISEWNIQIFFVMFRILLIFFFCFFSSMANETFLPFSHPHSMDFFMSWAVEGWFVCLWFLCLRHISWLQTSTSTWFQEKFSILREKNRRYDFWPKYISHPNRIHICQTHKIYFTSELITFWYYHEFICVVREIIIGRNATEERQLNFTLCNIRSEEVAKDNI